MRRRLNKILTYLKCPADCELSVLLTDDANIARLNQTYLGRSGPTNVLSFSQQEGGVKLNNLLGDVVVSLERARAEAENAGLEAGEHIMRLVCHGLLHLLGYHHEQGGKAARQMEALTEKILRLSADRA
jgi:rRNA maturation RNase YbeY